MNEKVLQAVIKLKDEISKPLKNVKNNMESLKKSTAKFNDNLKTVSKTSAQAGTVLTASMGSAIALCTKNAIEFESAFAGVKKTVEETANTSFADLEKGLKDLSNVMPQSASDLASIAEGAGQLGIETDNILKFTETMAMLGDATNLGSEEAATSFARFANIVGMSQDNFDRLGSTVVALGNNLATTESEITNMAMRLAGAGTQIGLTESQILAFAGALSSVGIEAEAGGTAFSKVMSSIQLAVETGNDSLKDFAKVAGKSTKEFSKAFKNDASKAIMEFLEGLSDTERLGKSTTAILSEMGIEEVRLSDALKRASNATDVFNNALDIGSKAWEDNIALTKEAGERYKTTESQLAIMKNQISNAFGEIGQSFLPILQDITNKVGEVANAFSNLDPTLQENVAKFMLLTAGIGAVLLVIGLLSPIITGITLVIQALGVVCGVVAAAFAFICTPVGAVMAAMVALTAVVVLIRDNWGKSMSQMKIDCKNAIDNIVAWWKNFTSIITAPIKAVVNIAKNVKESVTSSKSNSSTGQKSAWGTKRVVGNDVPYRLHDGERVLTRTEADRYDKGLGNQGVSIVVNGLTVREEADITKIANKLVQKINQNKMVYGGAY